MKESEGSVPCKSICIRGIDFSFFYDFSIGILNLSDHVVFFSSSFYYTISTVFSSHTVHILQLKVQV